jgi:hypothetical protein
MDTTDLKQELEAARVELRSSQARVDAALSKLQDDAPRDRDPVGDYIKRQNEANSLKGQAGKALDRNYGRRGKK